MIDQEFEGPLFKILSRNDSGESKGHQAGVVIPIPLRRYFPDLPAATAAEPAPHVPIRAVLVLDDGEPITATPSYQLQTWNLTRKGETRITGELQTIRKPSRPGDIILIERGRSDPSQYRLTILRQGTALYNAALVRTGGRKWGALTGAMPAVSKAEVDAAALEIDANTAGPFKPFEDDAQLQTVSKRIARSRAFRRLVIAAYGDRCAMCGGGAKSPSGVSEIEAAHVIPRALKGSDDIRNGIALCRLHHWAFDRQLIGLTPLGQLRVMPAVAALPENAAIAVLDGAPLLAPVDPAQHVHADAVAWSMAAFEKFWSGGP